MMRNITKAALVIGLLALAACSGMYLEQGNPTWVTLSGSDEVPPVSTMASGNGNFMVEADGSVSGDIATNGLKSTAAHIHMGAVGENGPVIITLSKSGDSGYSAPMGARLTPEQMVAFKQGKLYVNVHSAAHKGGEIRGQLRW